MYEQLKKLLVDKNKSKKRMRLHSQVGYRILRVDHFIFLKIVDIIKLNQIF